ncbi:peptide chain release factor 2 [Candidatus Caldatribacterium sp. SIUC1]|uniref:peptide chain release factor 2 n=1 Tax=Candidatus Caldatribacterium sp. SIUC1 TaxID=3418365 RepID=UPI003F6928F1
MQVDLSGDLTLIRKKLEEIGGYLEEERVPEKIKAIEFEMSRGDFWGDGEKQSRLLAEYRKYRQVFEEYLELKKRLEDTEELAHLVAPEDPEYQELVQEVRKLSEAVEDLDIRLLFRREEDRCNAIVTIHSGAGGTESQDWVEMLFRMYLRFCERKGFDVRVTDILEGEEAGLKHVTFLVQGEYAYGYLRSEHGVHRLIRISPFDANRRRHTTFALVDVIPEIGEDVKVEINPQDLRIETFRASGHGGQHVNVTDSAVRITHIPTGIVVQCQNERSQHQNKAVAMRILRARLYEYYRQEQMKKIQELKGERKDIAWGNQIRTYVFHPYTLVKDHRTGHETGNIERVMDGEIDDFIEAFLKRERSL